MYRCGYMTAKEPLEAPIDLEPSERDHLVESLVSEREFASDETARAWLDELQRRSAEIDAGTAELVNWTDVRSRIAARRAKH